MTNHTGCQVGNVDVSNRNASSFFLIENAGPSPLLYETYDIESRTAARPVLVPSRPHRAFGGNISHDERVRGVGLVGLVLLRAFNRGRAAQNAVRM